MSSRIIPTVRDCMTPSPIVVAPEAKLSEAKHLMHTHVVRHLPVVRDGELVGILSERDVAVVERLAHAPAETISVEDAMLGEPFAVLAETPLDVVAREMAGRRIGSAVVVEGDGKRAILGIFTSTDALHVLMEALGGDDLRSASMPAGVEPARH